MPILKRHNYHIRVVSERKLFTSLRAFSYPKVSIRTHKSDTPKTFAACSYSINIHIYLKSTTAQHVSTCVTHPSLFLKGTFALFFILFYKNILKLPPMGIHHLLCVLHTKKKKTHTHTHTHTQAIKPGALCCLIFFNLRKTAHFYVGLIEKFRDTSLGPSNLINFLEINKLYPILKAGKYTTNLARQYWSQLELYQCQDLLQSDKPNCLVTVIFFFSFRQYNVIVWTLWRSHLLPSI
jgi:hypothetical protein